MAIIAAAETVPLMVMASKSSTASTLLSSGRSLFSLSTKGGAGSRMAYETGSEFFSNGGRVGGDMNILGIGGASVFSSNLGAEFLGNKYSISFNEGLESYSLEETAINFAIGRLNSGIQGNLGQLSNLLGNEGGAVKAMTISFTLAGQTG